MRSEEQNNLQHILIKCITACDACATECLKEDNVSMMEKCIRIDRDCADICALLSRYIARESSYTEAILKTCIQMCRDCEAECKKHDHWHCKKCAEICHECHLACEDYLQHHLSSATA